MGLFSKRQEADFSPHLAPSPSPQYSSNQSLPQAYPTQAHYDQRIPSPSPSPLPNGPYQLQQQYPLQQQPPSQQQHPPQQYSQRTPSPSSYGLMPHNAYRASSPAAFPTPHSRILRITREGFSQRKAHIYEADNCTQAYEMVSSYAAEWSNSKPNLEITSSYTGQIAGTVNFLMMSRQIQIVVNGQMLALNSNGWATRGYSFVSSIGPLKWEASTVMGSAYACTTERGEWLAKCDQNVLTSMHGKGTIEIVNGNLPPGLTDELVVTGLAMIENERRNAFMAAGTAGAIGGAGGS
ncbi:MAG: hypothetical protein Q9209_005501 [Squamulea sp. 1 TL-2023]